MSHKVFPFIWSFLRREKFNFFMWFLIEVINDFLGIFVAQYFNKKAINYFQIENPILKNGLLLIILYVFFNNCTFIFKTALMKFKIKSIEFLCTRIANELFAYTIKHSINYFNNSFSGAISSKIQSVSMNSYQYVVQLMKIITSLVIFIFVPFFYAKINVYLAILFIVFSIIYVYWFSRTSRKYGERRKILSEENSKFLGFLVDDFTNIRNIKIFSNIFFERLNSKKHILDIRRAEKNMIKSQIVNQTVSFICTFSLFFSIIAVSAVLLAKNQIIFGDFVFVIIVLSISRFILINFIRSMNTIQAAKGAIENGLEVIYKPLEIKNKDNAKKLDVKNEKIVFKNIFFSYGGLYE